MKNLDTGEVTPPLPHEEWIAEQARVVQERLKAEASSSRKGKAASAEDEGDNRTLYGHKLSVYRRKAGSLSGPDRKAALMEMEGVGEARADEIADALDGK